MLGDFQLLRVISNYVKGVRNMYSKFLLLLTLMFIKLNFQGSSIETLET